ncbi:carbonic anhydrase IV c [Brachyhypopomus gauderio]|uniref:carbonic anhydrase IV c n=1 Tax=Brachyhypopomus gauderio TaxID=698409 RepID=UPI0040420DFE
MRSTLLLLYLLLGSYLCLAQWCYQSQNSCDDRCREPTEWYMEFPACGGQSQSPINIVSRRAQPNLSLTPFIFEGYTDVLNVTVSNVGYGALFTLPSSVRIRGGGLPDTYKAVQFHMHWGLNAGPGSEHTVDGEQFPMELHIVHIKEKYNNLNETMNDSTGIAVLGFLYEISPEENQQFNKVIKSLGNIKHFGNTSEVPSFRLTELLTSVENLSSYYRYSGSLTTPTCVENIIWTIFQKPLPISNQQMALLTQQMLFPTGTPMTDIFRPVQSLNGRIVYTSTGTGVFSRPLTLSLCLLCVFGLI